MSDHPSLVFPTPLRTPGPRTYPMGVAALDAAAPGSGPIADGTLTIIQGSPAPTSETETLAFTILQTLADAAVDPSEVVLVVSVDRLPLEVLRRLRAAGISEATLVERVRIAHVTNHVELAHTVAHTVHTGHRLLGLLVLEYGLLATGTSSDTGADTGTAKAAGAALLSSLSRGHLNEAVRTYIGLTAHRLGLPVDDQDPIPVIVTARSRRGEGSARLCSDPFLVGNATVVYDVNHGVLKSRWGTAPHD